jgi:hypothetical protein
MKITAQACQCAGFSTFLTNLISSSTFPQQRFARPWHKEYWAGLSCEIYRLPLSSRFEGLGFAACASEIYRQNQALLFAVKPHSSNEVELFPGASYILKENDIGYFIAEHFKVVESLSEDDDKRKKNTKSLFARQNTLTAADMERARFVSLILFIIAPNYGTLANLPPPSESSKAE